jgi:mRNA-binding protein PUF3
MLITDQYGNYVTQHVIQHGKPEDRANIIKIITGQLLTLSKHKFASNVVEKSIQFGTDEQRRAIVVQLTALHSESTSPLQLMMKDQYGNYVIRKFLYTFAFIPCLLSSDTDFHPILTFIRY